MFHLFCFRLEIPILGKFDPKNQNCKLRLKFGTKTNSNMQNSMGTVNSMGMGMVIQWGWSLNGPKNQICQFRLKFGS